MSQERTPASNLFTQVDITASSFAQPVSSNLASEHTDLLRNILSAQDRQNELLEELVNHMTSSQKQRQSELSQWKQANPHLARKCRQAAEALSRVQVEFLDQITEEVSDNADGLMDGEFMLAEFVDRFGPRLAHLNGVIQVLAQLSSVPNPAANNG